MSDERLVELRGALWVGIFLGLFVGLAVGYWVLPVALRERSVAHEGHDHD